MSDKEIRTALRRIAKTLGHDSVRITWASQAVTCEIGPGPNPGQYVWDMTPKVRAIAHRFDKHGVEVEGAAEQALAKAVDAYSAVMNANQRGKR